MFRYTLFLTSSLRSLAHRQRGLTDVHSTSRTSARAVGFTCHQPPVQRKWERG